MRRNYSAMEILLIIAAILLVCIVFALGAKASQGNKDKADKNFDHRRVGKSDRDTDKPFFL